MKPFLIFLFTKLFIQIAIAQPVQPALDNDPVFNQVLVIWLNYPDSFEYFPIYGRVYAGFQINQRGQIDNVSILSPGNTKSGFEYQVIQALKHMPPLNPRYAGNYALSVAFCYRNRTVGNSFYKPVNRLDDKLLINRFELKERECLFDWAPKKAYADHVEVWGYYVKKKSNGKAF